MAICSCRLPPVCAVVLYAVSISAWLVCEAAAYLSRQRPPRPLSYQALVLIASCKNTTGVMSALSQIAKYLDEDSTLVRIITKCGESVGDRPAGFGNVQAIDLPNVGRNDHSFAWALSQMDGDLKANVSHNAPVFFLKDNMRVHQHNTSLREFPAVLADVRHHGFGCFLKMESPYSDFHSIAELGEFKKNRYIGSLDNFKADAGQRPLSKWWDDLGITPWNRNGLSDGKATVVQVCYGGNFAVRMDRIRDMHSSLWQRLVASLERGDNIEEGHYAERTWAGLLAQSTPPARLTVCDPAHRSYPGRMCSKKS
mmetsp:Transcript_47381/g.127838  ORF Transcript_47381/g.127838 Transcript_47381/m.127838 type:complete len:311 (-) Transcript_47381:163-1095(-)